MSPRYTPLCQPPRPPLQIGPSTCLGLSTTTDNRCGLAPSNAGQCLPWWHQKDNPPLGSSPQTLLVQPRHGRPARSAKSLLAYTVDQVSTGLRARPSHCPACPSALSGCPISWLAHSSPPDVFLELVGAAIRPLVPVTTYPCSSACAPLSSFCGPLKRSSTCAFLMCGGSRAAVNGRKHYRGLAMPRGSGEHCAPNLCVSCRQPALLAPSTCLPS